MMLVENAISVGLQLLLNSASSSAEKIMIRRWSKEHSKLISEKLRRQKVLVAVREGYDTREEISASTGIHISTVRRILLDLERLKLIETKLVKTSRRPERRFHFVENEDLSIPQ